MQRLLLVLLLAVTGSWGCRTTGQCARVGTGTSESAWTPAVAASGQFAVAGPVVRTTASRTYRPILPFVSPPAATAAVDTAGDDDPRGALEARDDSRRAEENVAHIENVILATEETPVQVCNCERGCLGVPPPIGCEADTCIRFFGAPTEEFRAGDDVKAFGPILCRDVWGLVQPENLVILGVSAAAAIGIRQDLDGQVRRETAEHPLRWGDASRVLGHMGEAPYQVPVLGVCWGYSLWTDDPELHNLMSTVVSAYTISGLATLAIKGATDTDRPDSDWNGGHWGFPSYHAASAFTVAAVLAEYYGWDVGLPAYTLAGLIGWSRIDERDHDLSDVVFGAAMGWVIGKSVAGTHLRGDGRVRIGPWMHPTDGAAGVMFDTRF